MSRFLILLSILTPAIAFFGFQRPVYANTLPETVCVNHSGGPASSVAKVGWRTTDGAEHLSPRWGLPMGYGGYTCVELLTEEHPIATHHTFTVLATKDVTSVWFETKYWGGPENKSQKCPELDITEDLNPSNDYMYFAETKWWSYRMTCD